MRYTLILLTLIAVACGDEIAKKPELGPKSTNNQQDMGGLGDMADGGEQVGCALIDCDQNSRCVEHEGEAFCECEEGFEGQDGECASLNTVPSVLNVAISPNEPASPGEPLTCSYSFVDADGDADESTIEWLVNGSVVATGSQTFDNYEEGDKVACRVTPNDGQESGAALTSNTVTGPLRMIVRVGTGHSCVRSQTGGVTCWGHNFYGELGSPNSSTQAAFTPYALPHMTSGVTLMDLGSAFTCVVHDGQLKCWGSGGWSVLGPGITGHHPNPVTIFTSGVTELSAGATHMCVLHDGALKCWGGNSSGQVGNTIGNDVAFGGNPTPTTVPGMGSGVTKFAAGEDHTCAIRNGALHCWGSNRQGQLGRATNFNTTTPNPTPAMVSGLSSGVTDVVSGRKHTCALHNNVWKCWGLNAWSELGRTTPDSWDYNPSPVTAAIGTYTDIMAGGGNVCFIQDNALKCWGTSTSGQLNVDGISKSETTRDVLPATVTSFDIGNSHLCAVRDNSVYCWGSNFHGQMGTGTKSEDPFPPTLINL